MNKRVKIFLIAGMITVILVALLAGFTTAVFSKLALAHFFLLLAPATPFVAETNILVLGIDSDAGWTRSDTIMLCHVDPAEKKLSVVSIPRDTLMEIPGRGMDKINHSFAFGGPDLTRQTLEKLFGVEIPYYVTINLAGFINLIDELGGITIDVESRMFYVDNSGGLFVDLYPGIQHLTGKEALGYVRYRSDGGDLKRIDRQQKFIQALGRELMRKENIVKSPSLFFNFMSYVDTNMESRKVMGLSLVARSAQENGQISMSSLNGHDLMINGIYYMKPDEENVKDLTKLLLRENRS